MDGSIFEELFYKNTEKTFRYTLWFDWKSAGQTWGDDECIQTSNRFLVSDHVFQIRAFCFYFIIIFNMTHFQLPPECSVLFVTQTPQYLEAKPQEMCVHTLPTIMK